MFHLVNIAHTSRTYLCERQENGILRIWDEEGKELTTNIISSPISEVFSTVTERWTIAMFLNFSQWQKRSMEQREDSGIFGSFRRWLADNPQHENNASWN